jgi:hypothetical protein
MDMKARVLKISLSQFRNSYIHHVLEDETVMIRVAEEGKDTRQVFLTLQRFRMMALSADRLSCLLEQVAEGVGEVDEMIHLGGDHYAAIKSPWIGVQIRKYYVLDGEVLPSHSGVCLKLHEWRVMMNNMGGLYKRLKLESIAPCSLSTDHANQEGAFQCMECWSLTRRALAEKEERSQSGVGEEKEEEKR